MQKAGETLQDAYTQLSLSGYATNLVISSEQVYNLQLAFREAMESDFNTANALTIYHEIIKQVNIHMRHGEKSFGIIAQLLTLLNEMHTVLGFTVRMPEITEEVHTMYKKWQQAKQEKAFAEADAIRDALKAQNIRVR